jgi:RimJ/RimL family protein N-acetyltransferase/predicted SprT family Zn-dependent metalloprotease
VATFSTPPAAALDTDFLSLRQLTEVWLDEVEAMVNNPVLAQLTGTRQKFSRAQLEDWLKTRRQQTNRCDWAIMDSASGNFVGEIVLNEFDELKNSMNLRICLAAETWFDRGIGSSAIGAVLEYAFEGIRLTRVTLSVLTSNARAIRVYERLGFIQGRQYSESGLRYLRMHATKLSYIEALSRQLMGESLDLGVWSFSFDNGKRRAGLCDHTNKRISLSKYMSEVHPLDHSRQVMYHEIAHALAGAKHGHDAQWLRIATDLGYRNERFSSEEIARENARWLGVCANGHEYFRYRKPKQRGSCGRCAKGYDERYLLKWTERF